MISSRNACLAMVGLAMVAAGEANAEPAMSCKQILHAFSQPTVTLIAAGRSEGRQQGSEFCRVRGTILPDVGFEAQLPLEWNGRFYMVDNAGSGGRINARRMADARRMGYASASTDQGYDYATEGDSRYGYNNRQKEIDFGFRSVHVTTEAVKGIVETFYGEPPAYSYFVGGSAGGRQGMMEAQRFPDDFDGLLISAPTLNISKIQMWGLWKAQAMSGTGYISPDQMPALAAAVYGRCDPIDGVSDGVIDNPLDCDFDPEQHLARCESSQGMDCFTTPQIAALQRIYGGVRDSSGEQLFPGQSPGAEIEGEQPPWMAMEGPKSGWLDWVVYPEGTRARYLDLAEAFMKYTAFDVDDPDYDWTTFDFDSDPGRMAAMAEIVDAVDPNPSALRASGGKMIHYHHWADTAVPPINSIDYFDEVTETMGTVDDFYKFYLVPGGFHGAPGVGATTIPWFEALVDWVEHGNAPGELIAERSEEGSVVRTRRVCPHPQVATYAGDGDPRWAESFVCQESSPQRTGR